MPSSITLRAVLDEPRAIEAIFDEPEPLRAEFDEPPAIALSMEKRRVLGTGDEAIGDEGEAISAE